MKKIILILILLLSLLAITFTVIYSGNQKKSSISQTQMISDDDVIFTKAQTDNNQDFTNKDKENNKSEGKKNILSNIMKEARDFFKYMKESDISEEDIKKLIKEENEKYLAYPAPQINMKEIEKKYGHDPNAAKHKYAILHNKDTVDDCYIATFSNSDEYFIRCDSNINVAYGYESTKNPILIRYDITKIISEDVEISYQYKKTQYNDNWNLTSISVDYPFKDIEFVYSKERNGYKLMQYYWADDAYYPDGEYIHTRYLKKL